MNGSGVHNPANSHFIQLHKWQVEFCNGNHCSALILSHFITWHDWKLTHDAYYRRTNDIAEMHGDGRPQNAYLYFTIEDFSESILGIYGKNSILKAVEFLETLKVITGHKNSNPKYYFDKTQYFKFYPEVCNRWIEENYILKKGDAEPEENFQNRNMHSLKTNDASSQNEKSHTKNKLRKFKNKLAITDTTTDTTNREKAAAKENNFRSVNFENEAAASSEKEKNNHPNPINLNDEDLIIGSQLTKNQILLTQKTVEKISLDLGIDKQNLFEEVQFCLLSPNNLKGCNMDFGKKLSSIGLVIKRGQWQRPAGMFLEKRMQEDKKLRSIKYELNAAQSKLNHFQKLLQWPTTEDKSPYLKAIEDAKLEINT